MKTILDVVKGFKGRGVDCCFFAENKGDIFSVHYDYGVKIEGNETFICGVRDYDDYVTSLSHHAGKELFKQYLAADKTPLEKQTMTKTILDAVKHYRGVATHDGVANPIWYNCVSYNDRNGFYLTQYRTKHFLCSRMEFNWCVEDLATNYGRCSQAYLEYKIERGYVQEFKLESKGTKEGYTSYDGVDKVKSEIAKYIITGAKETKVDYTSEEFWKDAPEGATHVSPCTYGDWYYKEVAGELLLLKSVAFGWERSCNSVGFLDDNDQLIELPKTKPSPVFTKAMSDAVVYESNNSGSFIIIERDGSERAKIQFIKTGYTTVATNQNIKKGQVKDKMRPSVYGVGFVGDGHYTPRVEGNISKTYQTWVSMLERCYSDRQSESNPTYYGCTVCSDWHNFQVFAEWFNNNYIDGYQLDKDIKVKGNKMYSPFGCMFVSAQENVEHAHARLYTLLSPEGVSVDVYNMSNHCEKHGLCKGHMSSVATGKRPSHKGWTLDTRTDKEKALDDLSKMVGDCESDYGILQAIIDGKIHGVTWSGK